MGKAGRKKFKEQQRAKKLQKQQGSTTERKPKPYKETVRENALFEDYYKKLGIVEDDEWESFMACIKEPLPAAFRVTGSKAQAEQLLHLIKHKFFSELNTNTAAVTVGSETGAVSGSEVNGDKSVPVTDKQVSQAPVTDEQVSLAPVTDEQVSPAGQEENSTDAATERSAAQEVIKPPTCLAWYPDGLAWQLEYSRVSIRQNNTLKKLHSFLVSESESGNISRQEAVSMIPPLLMDIKSHHKVLDMCAAPGSKTAQIIEYLHADSADPMPEGFVIGNDVDNKRCYLMVHQIKRLQSPNFMIVNHDATRLPNMTYMNERTGKVEPLLFDRILCDVPCSGDGTLRKNPEVWRSWGPGHAINLHSVQNRVLSRGLELLAVGGRLVYSTCSFNPVENEAVVANMIKQCQGSIQLVDCSQELLKLKRVKGMKTWQVLTKNGDWFPSFDDVPENKRSWVRPSMFPTDNMDDIHIDRCMRVVPHHQNTGGFFIAVLEKTSVLPWQKVELEKAELEKAELEKAELEKVETGCDDAKNSEDTVDDGARTTTAPRQPPAKKIKYSGYREEPFYYVEENDSQWPSIKEFFGFDDSFDHTQFIVRSKESEKKRNIYLSSKSIKNVALYNEHRMKYINTGVKVLARSEHAMCNCSYRLVQDGISSVDKYVHGRRVKVEKADVIELLTQENPFFSQLTPSTHADIQKMDMGGLIMLYTHKDSVTQTESLILMTGWRGKTSCRVYVPKFERHHILRLCGVDPDKALVDSEWAVRGKTGTVNLGDKGPEEQEDGHDPSPSGDGQCDNMDTTSGLEPSADTKDALTDTGSAVPMSTDTGEQVLEGTDTGHMPVDSNNEVPQADG